MHLIDVGDRGVAFLVEAATPEARTTLVRRLADALREAAIAGVSDVVPSSGRVTVVYDPLTTDHGVVRRFLETVVASGVGATSDEPATRHRIPVCYGGEFGPDLDAVCAAHAIDRDRLVEMHTGPDYLVEAIGFLPGFAYLAGLPPELATPRRATPRRLVPAGAVGIGGGQTGAYPFASPGGWNLIGNTPVRLFDVRRPRPALLAAGDRVTFESIDPGEHARLLVPDRGEPSVAGAADGVTVLTPGLFTTIQDLGRPGHRASGVPLSGAADTIALRRANRLVGNPDDAACLEITLLGPDLVVGRDTTIAVSGAAFPGCEGDRAVTVRAGDTIRLGHAVTGCRGYVAVAGGILVTRVLGSASTFVPASLGGLRGLPLAAGDVLPVGTPSERPAERGSGALATGPRGADGATLRMIRGEQFAWCGDAIWSATHTVSSRSDRMGMRLEGAALGGHEAAGSLPSVAVLPGTVQLPPDGRPIVLMADAQTIGGYPVIGHVIAADLPLVAQLRPGDVVRWRETTIAEAHHALRQQADEECGR
jgi:KipI family sensor histidine kinase inhibitor